MPNISNDEKTDKFLVLEVILCMHANFGDSGFLFFLLEE